MRIFLWRNCNLSRFKLKLAHPHAVTLISAYLSDRNESRGITVSLVSVLAIVGFALYLGKVLYA